MSKFIDDYLGTSVENEPFDRGILIGTILAIALVGGAILFSGEALHFVSITSFAIVFGGTFAATLIHFSIYDIQHAWEALKRVIYQKDYHPVERIQYLVSLANAVRRDGLLILEGEASRAEDRFLRMACELTVDAGEHGDTETILENEMRTSYDRSSRAVQVFETMGTYAPALGLIGTLVGLIQMLGTLDDPQTVGPAMAVALVTTLYGALLSNLVFLPLAGKLRNRSEEELIVKSITIEAISAIGRGENPLVVEQRLQSFLPLQHAA